MRSGNTEMDESLQKRGISILEYLEWRNHIMEEVANILRSNGFEVYEYRLSMIGVSIYRPLDELPPHLKEVVEERIERIRKELAIRGYNESVIESVVKREAELGLQIVVDLVGIPQDLPKEFLPAIIRGKYPRGEVECAVSKSVYSILREMGFELGAEIPLRMIIYSHDTDGIGRREMRRSCKLVGVIGEDSFLHLTGSLSVNTTMMVTERGLRSLIGDTDRLTSLNLLAIGDPRNVSRALAKVNSMELVKRNKLYLVPATLLWRGGLRAQEQGREGLKLPLDLGSNDERDNPSPLIPRPHPRPEVRTRPLIDCGPGLEDVRRENLSGMGFRDYFGINPRDNYRRASIWPDSS